MMNNIKDVNMKTISADLVKSRIQEIQSEVERVKSDLVDLKDSSKGANEGATLQKLDELTRELIAYKSAQAELINLLN